MTVGNPAGNSETNTLTRIWDTLPNGTVIEFVGSGDPPLVQHAGVTETYCAEYTVREVDIRWIETPLGDYGVINTFEVEGYDSAEDSIYAKVTSNTRVIPPVGGEAFPINALAILAPWIALGAAVIAGAVIFARRYQAQG